MGNDNRTVLEKLCFEKKKAIRKSRLVKLLIVPLLVILMIILMGIVIKLGLLHISNLIWGIFTIIIILTIMYEETYSAKKYNNINWKICNCLQEYLHSEIKYEESEENLICFCIPSIVATKEILIDMNIIIVNKECSEIEKMKKMLSEQINHLNTSLCKIVKFNINLRFNK